MSDRQREPLGKFAPDNINDHILHVIFELAAELCVDVRHFDLSLFTSFFDVPHDLIDHELIVIFKSEGVLDGKSATDIDGVKLWTDFLQLAIEVHHLIEFRPIVDVVLDTLVQEDVQHLQLELIFISFDVINIELEDIFRSNAKS